MKKVFAVLISILLSLMTPVLLDVTYAADGSMTPETLRGNLEGVREPDRVDGIAPIDGTVFVDGTIPSTGWITIDADGDGHTWMLGEDIYPYCSSLDGWDSKCVISESYSYLDNLPLYPDNWLVSPAIEITAGKQLHFCVAAQDLLYFEEHYGAFISTSSQTDLSTFTKLFESDVDMRGGEYKVKTIDLTAYAGQTVYLAFRHFNCTDQFWLNLDGVGLSDAGSFPDVLQPEVIRVKGENRYETSIEIAKEVLAYSHNSITFHNAIIATGDNFADALAGTSLSSRMDAPILLVSDKVPASIDNAITFIDEYIDPEGSVMILGGTAAVPATVEDKLGEIGRDHRRFAGKNRYDTNLQILDALDMESDYLIYFCDGTNWPDAAAISGSGAPVMLVPKTGLTAEQIDFLNSIPDEDGNPVGKIKTVIIGGTAAIPNDIAAQIRQFHISTAGPQRRIAGKNRAETAAAIAWYLCDDCEIPSSGVTFVYGANYPDCIAAGILAYWFNHPILYGDSSIPAFYWDADNSFVSNKKLRRAFVVGGESLIADDFVYEMLRPSLLVD